MPVTRSQQIYRTRDLLKFEGKYPFPNAPSFHDILRQEISTEMDIVNASLQTGRPWGTAEYQLNYTPAQNTYTLNVDNWGKVLYVVRVTGNQYIPYVTVPFDDVQTQHYGTIFADYTNTYGSFAQPNETAERMSFYREGVLNAEYKVKINPMPQISWTYLITYLPGYIGTADPLTAAIQLPEHAELVRIRNALALLPQAQWSEDIGYNKEARLAVAAGLVVQKDVKEINFSNYIKSIALGSWQGGF